MVKTDLTEEEKKRIADALSNNTEPPSELMTKLFPRLAEKFDVAKLDRARRNFITISIWVNFCYFHLQINWLIALS